MARAFLTVPIARPLTTLENPEQFLDDISALVRQEKAAAIVIGLPRGLDGQETAQTSVVRKFGRELEGCLTIPLYWTDEAVTSSQAEAELRGRNKPFTKGDVDALAATYILDDFIRENPGLAAEVTNV